MTKVNIVRSPKVSGNAGGEPHASLSIDNIIIVKRATTKEITTNLENATTTSGLFNFNTTHVRTLAQTMQHSHQHHQQHHHQDTNRSKSQNQSTNVELLQFFHLQSTARRQATTKLQDSSCHVLLLCLSHPAVATQEVTPAQEEMAIDTDEYSDSSDDESVKSFKSMKSALSVKSNSTVKREEFSIRATIEQDQKRPLWVDEPSSDEERNPRSDYQQKSRQKKYNEDEADYGTADEIEAAEAKRQPLAIVHPDPAIDEIVRPADTFDEPATAQGDLTRDEIVRCIKCTTDNNAELTCCTNCGKFLTKPTTTRAQATAYFNDWRMRSQVVPKALTIQRKTAARGNSSLDSLHRNECRKKLKKALKVNLREHLGSLESRLHLPCVSRT